MSMSKLPETAVGACVRPTVFVGHQRTDVGDGTAMGMSTKQQQRVVQEFKEGVADGCQGNAPFIMGESIASYF
jgi:hypothetical protein